MKIYMAYKKISHILSWIFNIFAITILFLAFITVIQYKSNAIDANLFGYKLAFVGTGSMEPEIRENGLVLLKKYEGQELKKGDIITFVVKLDDNTKVVVTHRIYNVKEDGSIITKGDNNSQADGKPITKSDVHFTHVKTFNQTAQLYDMWQTSSGKFVIACVVLFFIFIVIAYNSFISYLDEKYGYAFFNGKGHINPSIKSGDRFLVLNQGLTDNHFSYIYIDKQTGVQYILINSSSGVTISPLLDIDGKPAIYDLSLLEPKQEEVTEKESETRYIDFNQKRNNAD